MLLFFCFLSLPSQASNQLVVYQALSGPPNTFKSERLDGLNAPFSSLPQPPCAELSPLLYFCSALHVCCPPPRKQGHLGSALHKRWAEKMNSTDSK